MRVTFGQEYKLVLSHMRKLMSRVCILRQFKDLAVEFTSACTQTHTNTCKPNRHSYTCVQNMQTASSRMQNTFTDVFIAYPIYFPLCSVLGTSPDDSHSNNSWALPHWPRLFFPKRSPASGFRCFGVRPSAVTWNPSARSAAHTLVKFKSFW